eukprot:GHRR01026182.1.p1 GENE.GHRR01026182.1~~GHRR01026182.1.p1  ORF type:complete len:193 (+),score=32.57 GHRR01026182.1:531-1109(+)
MLILDNHSSDAMWCCGLGDGNGLWYTANWTEQQWLAGWQLMAHRYADVSAVVGVGLRNEPRPTFISELLWLHASKHWVAGWRAVLLQQFQLLSCSAHFTGKRAGRPDMLQDEVFLSTQPAVRRICNCRGATLHFVYSMQQLLEFGPVAPCRTLPVMAGHRMLLVLANNVVAMLYRATALRCPVVLMLLQMAC